ncbi:MAG: BrnT family toxin [Clostridiales bacterium]|nr:BrnT family toxin [Clostridiales bacterium]
MTYEWDSKKNEDNVKKHGISFEKASRVFADPLQLSVVDKRFSYFEERWITIGKADEEQLIVIANIYFNNDDEEVIRIISARKATANERKQYEK